ncbi:MAG: flagellar basal body rod protein FlgC [Burkholderiaceae bacterium]|jgi:flagellar basal-body rod protein FlgC|nr:flagellar basal body rod protein FlgC [Betaproteobacteria bacterium]NBT84447.1 flagellar basal body rod protein FlgC [Betaproteobacteria bacterium]
MSLMRAFEIGSTGLVAQSIRLNTTASNIANVETLEGPDGRPYRGRQVVFRTTPIQGTPGAGVEVANIVENDAPLRKEYKPGHPRADGQGYIEMPNVNPVEEMVNMISASRSYQMNIELMSNTRLLITRTLSMGK